MLTNVDNTIEGETSNSGTFGNNDTAIINSGVINANVNGAALVIDPVAGSGTFNNQSGGTVEASNGGILSLSGNGGGDFLNAGTIQQVSGGSIQLTGILTSSGVIDLGVNAMNINGGTLTLLSSSKLSLQIGSLTAYGQITGNGTIALNGQLILSLVNGYQPGSGNTFTIITGSNVSGSFTNLNSGRVAVTGGGSFLVTETGTTVTLSNYSATMAAAIHKAFTANVPASSSVTTKSTAATEPQANSDKVVVSKVAARSTSTGTGALVSSKQASRSGAVKIIHVSDSSQLQTLMDKAHPSGGRMIVQPNAANTKSSPEGKLGRNAVWRETLEARDKRPDQMPRNMQARLPQ
ncbi:MAG: hypothetical protein JO354_13180 [Verrucomicrobia bacterium]|nr:hypothetical protein [Verrucomicrobiota bacterium]